MNRKDPIPVHETAFMIASFRAAHPDLSKDVYAELWQNPAAEKWIKAYLDQVSREEVLAHCLRNRYFHDTVQTLAKQNSIDVLVNFGAGLSMYPYSLKENLIHIEIDKPDVMAYKTEKTEQWKTEGRLPKTAVHRIGVDFTQDYQEGLYAKLKRIAVGKRCFILLEGVLFFLTPTVTQNLFQFFDTVQKPGDFVGSGSFRDTLKETKAYQNLIRFFDRHFSASKNPYQTLNDDFYRQQNSYKLIDRQDYFSLSQRYGHRPGSARGQVLNENFYILEKG